MNCPECNENKKQRNSFDDSGRCGCCNGARKISFNRYVQYNIGWVLWLKGGIDASVYEMNARCIGIIVGCFKKYNKTRFPILEKCENDDANPREVTVYFANQFKGEDCLTIH